MKRKIHIYKGQQFGYLKILEELPPKKWIRYVLAQCVCGKIKTYPLYPLVSGKTKSCGCRKCFKHGLSNSRLWKTWYYMKERCCNPKASSYNLYGAKGIRVCEEWLDFENFYQWSIDNGYKEEIKNGRNIYTLDRINGNKNYCPDNCRWTTYRQQNCNHKLLCTNTSGYRGVSWSKKENKWICVISINNKSKRIGCYKTQKDAVMARNKFIEDNNLPNQKNEYIGELSNGK